MQDYFRRDIKKNLFCKRVPAQTAEQKFHTFNKLQNLTNKGYIKHQKHKRWAVKHVHTLAQWALNLRLKSSKLIDGSRWRWLYSKMMEPKHWRLFPTWSIHKAEGYNYWETVKSVNKDKHMA